MPVVSTLASASINGFTGGGGIAAAYYYFAAANNSYFSNIERNKTYNNVNYLLVSRSTYPYQQFIVSFNSDGSFTEPITLPTSNRAVDFIIDNSGNLIVLYEANANGSPSKFIIQKYNNAGTLLYSKIVTYSATVATTSKVIGLNSDGVNTYVMATADSILFCTKLSSSFTVSFNNYCTTALPNTTTVKVLTNQGYNSYTTIQVNTSGTPWYTSIITCDSLGNFTWNDYSISGAGLGTGGAAVGIVQGSNIYTMLQNNILAKLSITGGSSVYGYSIGAPSGTGTPSSIYSGIAYNGNGNVVLTRGASSAGGYWAVPLNANNPSVSISASPTEYRMANFSLSSISSSLYATYISTTLSNGTYVSENISRLPSDGNLILGPQTISYVVNGQTFSGTLTSFSRPNVTTTPISLARTPRSPSSFILTYSIADVSMTPVSQVLYSYSKHLV